MLEGLYKILGKINYIQNRFNVKIEGFSDLQEKEIKSLKDVEKKKNNFSAALKEAEENIQNSVTTDNTKGTVNLNYRTMPLSSNKNIDDIIQEKSLKYNIDPKLIKSVIKAESNFNPNAISEKGASGLMQLLPSTAKDLGVNNIFDAEENIEGGSKYLRQLLDRYNGDIKKALAAYNAGLGVVDKYDNIPPIPETNNFINNVLESFSEDSEG